MGWLRVELRKRHRLRQIFSWQFQCVSRKGNGYDNAPMEGFLKVEAFDHQKYAIREQALRAVTDDIERSHNPKRLHSTLDYFSPTEFKQRLLLK